MIENAFKEMYTVESVFDLMQTSLKHPLLCQLLIGYMTYISGARMKIEISIGIHGKW